jgi:hypothetical protein
MPYCGTSANYLVATHCQDGGVRPDALVAT